MNKLALAFLLGTLIPAVSIYLSGGSSRTCLAIGIVIGLAPAVVSPRRVARFLWAASHTWEDAKGRFITHAQDADKGLAGGEVVTVTPTPTVSPVAEDVVSALVNMKVPKKKAEELVGELGKTKTYKGFNEMFTDAVAMARKV